MRKRGKKLLAMMLAMSMTMNVVSMQAFADEPVVEVETQDPVDNGDGTETGATITTTTTTDSETGNVTVNVVIEQKTKDTNPEDGVDVSGESTREEETITDEDGKLVEESWVEDGTEKKEWTEEDSGDGEQEEVEVPLVPGEKTEATDIDEETTGDVNSQEGQTTTTTTDRTVTAETSEVKVTVNDSNTGLVGEQEIKLEGLVPVYDVIDGVEEDKGGMFDFPGQEQFNSGLNSKWANLDNWKDKDGNSLMPEDADLRFLGTGEHTTYYAAVAYVIYEKDENGNTIYDENGKPVIKELWRYNPATHKTELQGGKNQQLTINGEPATELPEDIFGMPEYDNSRGPGGNRPTLHVMMDEYGNKVYSYCIDNMQDTKNGEWYKISNLEDSDYYASEEAENHIRNIVLNGYWGTSDIPNEDGSYNTGSVELLKQNLREAVKGGLEVPGYDTEQLLNIIDNLTSGEAMIATQAAIWSYSNGSIAAQNGKDGYLIIDPDQHANHQSGSSKKDYDILDADGGARIDLVYTWLMSLSIDGTEESTVVINEKNFVKDMGLTVGDKITDNEKNKDNDEDNDVYNTDLNFKLAFVPGENDDLLVQITYEDLDGNPVNVVRRLAGDEDGYYETITPDSNGVYVITGLVLSENKDFNFDLRLEGTQYLENGVYIYESVNGRTSSQNFVGIAEGERNVDVSLGVTIKFEVDEDNHVVAERKWHDEGSNRPRPTGGNDDDDDNGGGGSTTTTIPDPVVPLAAADTIEISDGDIPLSDGTVLNIEDAPIPLAVLPMTGDVSVIWMLISLISGLGLAGLSLADRKKCR